MHKPVRRTPTAAATGWGTLPRWLALLGISYGVCLGLPGLVSQLPPEIAHPLRMPAMLFGIGVLVFSVLALSKLGGKSFLAALLLLIPLGINQALTLAAMSFFSPTEIADKLEAPDGSATLYSMLEHGMPDNSQVICIQRSLLSGCEHVDSWQSQRPCKGVLPVYMSAYLHGKLSTIRDCSSAAQAHRGKCGKTTTATRSISAATPTIASGLEASSARPKERFRPKPTSSRRGPGCSCTTTRPTLRTPCCTRVTPKTARRPCWSSCYWQARSAGGFGI